MEPISQRSAERMRAYAFDDLQVGRISPRQYNQVMAEVSRAEYRPHERELVDHMMHDLRRAPRVLRGPDCEYFYRELAEGVERWYPPAPPIRRGWQESYRREYEVPEWRYESSNRSRDATARRIENFALGALAVSALVRAIR